VVVIPPRRDHSAVETGYYKTTDIAKQGNSFFFKTNIRSFKSRTPVVEETELCSIQT
jgi:hypothetical protein